MDSVQIRPQCGAPQAPQSAIEQAKQSGNPTDIILHEGIYRLKKPIQIHDCKTPLSIRPADGETAVLTAAQPVTTPFQKWERDEIYYAEIGADQEIQAIFVNGEPYIMCRYPNEQPGEILGGYAKDTLSRERTARWQKPAGGYVRALHKHEWGGNSFRILGKNPDGSLQLDWVGDNNRGDGCSASFVMVENLFEELDAPGEWFYDRANGRLYLIFREGTDAASAQAEYATGHALLDIRRSERVEIRGLAFRHTNRTLFDSVYEKRTRSDWSIAQKGAVFLEDCKNVALSGCSFMEIGSNCIYLKDYNEAIAVSHCDFRHCGASGVVVFGSQSACRDLSTWENQKTTLSDTTPGPQNEKYPRGITVENCYFYDLGRFEKQSAAVTLSVASHITVRGNTIHHLPRAGINICDGCFGGHLIENNDLFDCVRETGDHGPFNSWGRDRFWSLGGEDTMGRRGSEKKPYALLDAVEPVRIHHNRVVGSRGFGIDLDDGSSNYEITDNLCCGVGIKLREGFFRTVRNNLLLGAPIDLHATYAGNDDIVEHNVVISPDPLHVVILNTGYTTKVDNNLFFGAQGKAKRNRILRGRRNLFLPAPDGNPLEQRFPAEAGFQPFSLSFGREGCPEPDQAPLLGTGNLYEIRRFGSRFTQIDETRRSLCGLPDYEGIYVAKLSPLSRLYRRGVRQGDVLRAENGVAVTPARVPGCGKKGNRLIVFRGQKQLELK